MEITNSSSPVRGRHTRFYIKLNRDYTIKFNARRRKEKIKLFNFYYNKFGQAEFYDFTATKLDTLQ